MKFRLGLRSSVLILFLGLYFTSLIILNQFFISKQRQTTSAFGKIELDSSLSSLHFETKADSLLARELLNNFRQALAASEMISSEAQIYSAVFLLLLMLLSVLIFVIILYKITKPLNDLQSATAKIRHGDFSVQVKENGIREIRDLKQSFNRMSRELKQVQKKLIEAEKEMIWKELSRILAHEIKNPLTPIQLAIQRLEEKFESDRDKFYAIFPESSLIISQEINNLQTLAASFSTFARNINPEPAIFNACDAVKDIIKAYQHRFQIRLEGLSSCQIKFDPTHFYQIVTNILQNAIDASGKEDEIVISFSREDDSFIVSIADQGSGIPEEELERIFEPYYTRKKKGTGLGLALVKKLCDMNSTEIFVDSKIENGTIFKLKIKSEL